MLILRRKEGQWVEITHKSGDTIRLRVYNIRTRYPGQLDLAFDDDDAQFRDPTPERAVEQRSKSEAALGATVASAMNPQHRA